MKIKLVNLDKTSREVEVGKRAMSAGVIIVRDPSHNSNISHVYRFCDTRRVGGLPVFEEVVYIDIYESGAMKLDWTF